MNDAFDIVGGLPVLLAVACAECGHVLYPAQPFGCTECGAPGERLTGLTIPARGVVLAKVDLADPHDPARTAAAVAVARVRLSAGPVVCCPAEPSLHEGAPVEGTVAEFSGRPALRFRAVEEDTR